MPTKKPHLFLTREDIAAGRFPADALRTHEVRLCGSHEEASALVRDQEYLMASPETAAHLRETLTAILKNSGADGLRKFILSFESSHGRLALPAEFIEFRSSAEDAD